MTLRPGLWIYADSHDVARENQAATMKTLIRCGAVGVLPCIEGQNGHRAKLDDLRALHDLCREADLSLCHFTFPSILGDQARSRDWYSTVREALGVPGQLDAEPEKLGRSTFHWTPEMIATWRALDPAMTITTTRHEAPYIGPVDCEVWAQLESQSSLDTLDEALRVFGRTCDLARCPLVTGAFNQPGDPRTVAEVRHDLTRATKQAQRALRHGVWSVHTIDGPKADVLRAWAIATWAPPVRG